MRTSLNREDENARRERGATDHGGDPTPGQDSLTSHALDLTPCFMAGRPASERGRAVSTHSTARFSASRKKIRLLRENDSCHASRAALVTLPRVDGPHRPRTIPEAIETAAAGLDVIIEHELRELAANGADDDILTDHRARLAAWRRDTLADLWVKFEDRDTDAEV